MAPTSLLAIIDHMLKNFRATPVIKPSQIAGNPLGAMSSVAWTDAMLKEKLQRTLPSSMKPVRHEKRKR